MIALIGSMLRARRLQALIIVLLGTVTIAVAVAVPAFLAAADNAVIANELAHVPASQRNMHATTGFKLKDRGDVPDISFGQKVPALMSSPGFDVTFSSNTDVSVLGGPRTAVPRLEFRQDQCDHIVIVTGRCVVSTADAMIDASLAKRENLSVGSPVVVAFAVNSPGNGWEVQGGTQPMTLTVVAIYRPIHPDEAYWGEDLLFTALADRNADAPILTAAGTIDAIEHHQEEQSVDAILIPSALTIDRMETIRGVVGGDVAAAEKVAPGIVAGSQIPSLVDAIEQDRRVMREVVPILAVPLIALGCFVMFLAGGYAVSGRREELGVVALRGSSWRPRWMLGVGESVVALAVSVPLGYVVGDLAVRLTARFVLPGRPAVAGFGHGAARYVLITVAVCLLAILAAAYRTLRAPTSELLRNVPPRASLWRSASIELVVVALAVVGIIAMRGEHAKLTGIELIAPGLGLAALGALAARLVPPMAGWIGRRCVRRPRGLGVGIGALQVARRPGAARIFALLVVATGLVTYGAAALDVGKAARADRANQELGAAQVVDVAPVSRLRLLTAVRKLDPAGTFAMAAAWVPQPSTQDPPILAVDSSRLAAVAAWPDGSPLTPQQVTRLLRQPAADPIVLIGETVSLDVTVTGKDLSRFDAPIAVDVEPLTTGVEASLDFGKARDGRHTYTSVSSACALGCRLVDVNLSVLNYQPGNVTVTFHALKTLTPKPATVTTFASASTWYAQKTPVTPSDLPISATADGLTLGQATTYGNTSFYLMSADSAYPAPAISTEPLTHTRQGSLGATDSPFPVRQAGVMPALPRLANNGILVDLQNVDRIVPSLNDTATQPEVWLSSSAPAGVVSRLSAVGLSVVGVSSIGEARGFLGRRGAAVGGLFVWVVVAGAVVLVVGGVVLAGLVDRGRRGGELWWLRVQGLSVGGAGGAVWLGLVGLMVVGWVVGVVGGLVVWWLTGGGVPLFVDGFVLAGGRAWPSVWGVVRVAGAVGVVLLAASWAVAVDLRRVVRRGPRAASGTASRRDVPAVASESAGSAVGSSR